MFELTLDNVTHSIKLHDTAGQEEYDRVRKLFYQDADCFILCYSIDNKASFQNICQKWIHELRSIDRRVPIVLVGKHIIHFFFLNQTSIHMLILINRNEN